MNDILLAKMTTVAETPKETEKEVVEVDEKEVMEVEEKGDGDGDKNKRDREKIKNLFQQFNDICKQLEVEIIRCKTVDDLFTSDLLMKRFKLRDLCEKIMYESPKSHGILVRDKFWRHGLYDPFTRAKYLKKNNKWTPLQLAYIRNHIQGGIGQLNCFLFKVKATKEQPISPFLSDSLQNILNGGIGDCQNLGNVQDFSDLAAKNEKWRTDIFYSCMMNIGDLYRYLVDIYSKDEDPEIAETYYYRAQNMYVQAFLLNPNNGMAHNNLGNLSFKLNGGIDSTYYLLYSMTCVKPYDGARSNLKQLLDKKLSEFARRPATIEPKLIELFSNNFLSLLQSLLFVETRISNFDRIFTEVIEGYNELITTNDPDVDGKFLFHISSITVIAIWKLTSLNSNNTSSAIALALSIFFNGLTKIGSIIEQHSQIEIIDEDELKLIQEKEEAILKESFAKLNVHEETNENESNDNDALESVNDDEKTTKLLDSSGILGYRRKLPTRRGSRSSDEDEYEEDIEEIDDDEDIVSLDHFNEESDDYSDKSSEYNDDEIDDLNPSQIDNKAFDSVSSSSNSQNNTEEKMTTEFTPLEEDLPKQERFVINKEDLVKCWSQLENLFVAIFPYLKLLQNTGYVLKHVFAANCEKVVLKKLADTLNLLRRTDWMKILEDINVNVEKDWTLLIKDPFMEEKDKKIFKFELPEDRSLYGLEPIKDTFEELKRIELNDNEKMLIRISRLLIFGHWLTEAESLSLLYSEEECSFYIPTPQDIDRHIRMVRMRELKNMDSGNKSNINIVNKLTQLYQEMTENERRSAKPIRRRTRNNRYIRGKRMDESEQIYVVVDLEAVLDYFSIVERLVHHFKFIVVLPYSVWITLDKLKDSKTNEKGIEEALIVFKWFEESAKGRRDLNIRSQKEHETVPIDYEYPKNRKGREFFDMMECCNFLLKSYFTDKRGRGHFFNDIRDKYRVLYLTGQPQLLNSLLSSDTEEKDAITFSTIGVSKGVGVFLDHISVYPPKKKRWRGKKSKISGHGG